MAMSIKFSIKKISLKTRSDPVEVKKVKEVKTIETVKIRRDDMQKPLKMGKTPSIKKK